MDPHQSRMETERLVIRLVEPSDAGEVIQYLRRNAAHLARWAPDASGSLDLEERRASLALRRADADEDRGYFFAAMLHGGDRIVARVNLSNIVRGLFLACHLGYSVDAEHEGTGIASEAVRAVVGFAFDVLGLHRVMANYQPANERSGKLLRRLGFTPEGYARDYLFIDGAWRDHILTSLIRQQADP